LLPEDPVDEPVAAATWLEPGDEDADDDVVVGDELALGDDCDEASVVVG
jgi:hypothetical protein